METRAYAINIVGLTNKEHHFTFEMGSAFFERYGSELVSQGALTAEVVLDKRETFIDATFSIQGVVNLICDRSLEPFEQTVKRRRKLVFKFGDVAEELSDEIIMISWETERLELGQYLYEFIALELPMKKLHPRFRDEEAEDDSPEGKIIYSSTEKENNDPGGEEDIDPRWEKLKEFK